MPALRVGFIGTGPQTDKPSGRGFGMAHQHAAAYRALPAGEVELVACADLVPGRAADFAGKYGIPAGGVYSDYHRMLAEQRLDLVSVCTWPDVHAPIVIDVANHPGPKVKGVFCEKPMADTWGAAKGMHRAAADNGVKLAFNHQRRFGLPFRTAKRLAAEGAVGRIVRVEFGFGNLCDYGSHSFDLSGYFAGQTRAKWVFAQIDYRREDLIFGQHQENSALVQWEYENGVFGLGCTGQGAGMVGCHNRIVGSEGVIEIGPRGEDTGGTILRSRAHGAKDWRPVDTGKEDLHGTGYVERAAADVVAWVKGGTESELSSRIALGGTEIIFAAWHSSRVRGVVALPLEPDDNALADLVRTGRIRPARSN